MKSTFRLFAMLGIATLSLQPVAGAQVVDGRWQPWIGCWKPVANDGIPARARDASTRVCVAPVQGTSAVELTTIAAGKVVERARIEADGQPHPVSRDGCTGTETAQWSMTGTRVYLSALLNCANGIARRGTGVLAFSENAEWLDIRGMTSNKVSGVAVGRFVQVGSADLGSIPDEVRRAVPAHADRTNAALLAASAPLTLSDIADVSTIGDSSVTAAWLIERTRGLKLSIDGRKLEQLADQGVPTAVIDVAVALAYPNAFAVDPRTRGGSAISATDPRVTSGRDNVYLGVPPSAFGSYYGGYYSPYDYWYGYGPFDPLFGYRYGSGYGYGYGYGPYGGYSPYYGSYYNGTPAIIVIKSNDTAPPPHGRVVKGQGYTSGGGSTTTSAAPRPLTSPGSSAGSTGSTSGSSSAGSSSGSGSSSGGRTAVKKP